MDHLQQRPGSGLTTLDQASGQRPAVGPGDEECGPGDAGEDRSGLESAPSPRGGRPAGRGGSSSGRCGSSRVGWTRAPRMRAPEVERPGQGAPAPRDDALFSILRSSAERFSDLAAGAEEKASFLTGRRPSGRLPWGRRSPAVLTGEDRWTRSAPRGSGRARAGSRRQRSSSSPRPSPAKRISAHRPTPSSSTGSTSRQPGSTPSRAASSGRSSPSCTTAASPSSSRPPTWTRPSTPPGSDSSTAAGSSP